jgi:hypothetical protein
MKIIKIILTAVLLISGCSILGFLMYAKPITLSFSQEEAQEKINLQLPIINEKANVKGTINDIQISFLETNEVSVTLQMDAEGYGLSGNITGETKTGITYHNGNFFLKDLDLSDLTITPNNDSLEKLDDAKVAAQSLWNKFKKDVAQTKEESDAFENLKNRAIEKLKPAVTDIVNSTLTTTPVYSLNGKDYKQSLAAAALEDITFTQSNVDVTLDPRNALLWILGWCLLIGAFLLLSFGILASGGAGAGFFFFS